MHARVFLSEFFYRKFDEFRLILINVPSLPDDDGFDVMKMKIMRRNTYNVMKMKY